MLWSKIYCKDKLWTCATVYNNYSTTHVEACTLGTLFRTHATSSKDAEVANSVSHTLNHWIDSLVYFETILSHYILREYGAPFHFSSHTLSFHDKYIVTSSQT